jgi:hypothetical protein
VDLYILHNDLKMPFVNNEIRRVAARYKAQTANHDNKLVEEIHQLPSDKKTA